MTSKDPQATDRYDKKYKDYRNLLPTIMKKSKTNYYNHCSEFDWSNLKDIHEQVPNLLTIKNISADIPRIISIDSTIITNLIEISKVFEDYFPLVSK